MLLRIKKMVMWSVALQHWYAIPAESVSNDVVKNVDILTVICILQKSLSEGITLEINIASTLFLTIFSTAWKLKSMP